jgi:starch synthase
MRILYITPEAFPFAKTGGLSDVAGALPSALAAIGHDVKVLLPKYGCIDTARWDLRPGETFSLKLGGETHSFRLWSASLKDSRAEFHFLENDPLFGRSGIYQENGVDYPDNLKRFTAFSRAALEVPKRLSWHPDILHANDWQTAPVFAYRSAFLQDDPVLGRAGTVFTIHNLSYQGLFPAEEFKQLDLPGAFFASDGLEFFGRVNLMKAGLLFSRIISTVSPTYSREILTPEFGCGLEGLLKSRRKDVFGILNGVDYGCWDPSLDSNLPQTYQFKTLKGKQACKIALQRETGLPPREVPVLGLVSRLVSQKGTDLLLDIMDELMYLDLQLIVLGSGEADFQDRLREAGSRHPEKIAARFDFDDGLAHRIYGGSDLFLMPSRFEPCGLGQLYAMRYGSVPVVHRTGGLADTVVDAVPSNIESETATGFAFEGAHPHAFLTVLRLALRLYEERALWKKIVRTAMSVDFSWERSAREYDDLYRRAVSMARQV